MLRVPLRPGLRGGRWACLRPLCGYDEALIEDTTDGAALIERLLIAAPGTTVGPGKAAELAVCDCDRVFAALYLRYYGEVVQSNVTCPSCGRPFETSFSLRDLTASLDGRDAAGVTGPEDGVYTLPDGRRFRLPTVEDQQSVAGLDPEHAVAELLARCVMAGEGANPEDLQAAMEEAGPTLDLDLPAACPHCSAQQTLRFDIQTHFLCGLAFEKRFLMHEIHHIAMAYRWNHQDILSLRREDRRAFVRLIQPAFRRLRG